MEKYALVVLACFMLGNASNILEEKQNIVKKIGQRHIHVISPASGNKLIEQNVKLFFGKILNCTFSNTTDEVPFVSNTDEYRLQNLKDALTSNSSDIIWCLRGGYGTSRIIDSLKDFPKPEVEKPVIGYSDITALHLFLSKNWGWKPIWGPMMYDLVDDKKSVQSLSDLVDIVTRESNFSVIRDLKAVNKLAKQSKTVQGKITGGTITLIQNSLHTSWEIEGENKIVFLEDVHEKGYKIDRVLTQFYKSGIFKKAKAIVLGHFEDCDELTDYALERFAKLIEVPVFKTSSFGHGQVNTPLVYNSEGNIDCLTEFCEFKMLL